MNATNVNADIDVDGFIERIAPSNFLRDPLGLLSGYRAYQISTRLYAMTDEELADLGLTRFDIPAVASRAISNRRDKSAA